MPNLHCTLPESDFDGYDIMQEIIAGCVCRLVKERRHLGISLFTSVFLQYRIKKYSFKK
jgi:hypothetical protein